MAENGLFEFFGNLEKFRFQISGSMENIEEKTFHLEPITVHDFYYPLMASFYLLVGTTFLFILELIWPRTQSQRHQFHVRILKIWNWIVQLFVVLKRNVSKQNLKYIYNRCKQIFSFQNLRNLFDQKNDLVLSVFKALNGFVNLFSTFIHL